MSISTPGFNLSCHITVPYHVFPTSFGSFTIVVSKHYEKGEKRRSLQEEEKRGWGQMENAKTLKNEQTGTFLTHVIVQFEEYVVVAIVGSNTYDLLMPQVTSHMDRPCRKKKTFYTQVAPFIILLFIVACFLKHCALWAIKNNPCKHSSQMVCSALELLPNDQKTHQILTLCR